MSASPTPPVLDEPRRLAALRAYGITERPDEPNLDRIVALASTLLGLPTAAINLLDDTRQTTVHSVGWEREDVMPREASMCTVALGSGREGLVVPDALADPRFADKPQVRDGLRCYAGAPLLTSGGQAIGALCVSGTEPRTFTADEIATLRTLADAVMTQMDLSRQERVARGAASRLHAVIDNAPDAFVAADDQARILEWNRKAEVLFGWTREEVLGTEVVPLLFGAERAAEHRRRYDGMLRTGATGAPVELDVLRRDATGLPIEVTTAVVEDPEHGTSIQIFARDITDRRRVEAERAEAARAFDALRTVARRLARSTCSTDAYGEICRAAGEVARAPRAQFWREGADGLLHCVAALDDDQVGLRLPATSVAATAFLAREAIVVHDAIADPRVDDDFALRHGVRAMAYQPILLDGTSVGVLSVAWPTTLTELSSRALQMLELLAAEAAVALERSALVARLEDLTRTDPLTHALNRRGLDEELTREIARCRRHGLPLSIAMLDLDHFKALNDSRGHAFGDEVLRDSAVAWRELLRESDTLARHGGEEFVVVLPGCSAQDAAPLVDRLRAATACAQTVSAGLATWTPGETPDELICRADAALYRAKDAGRDRTIAA